MAAARKGTATPLGAVFPPEETRRAVARVAEAVADRRAELARLRGFVSDNAALVSLVQRLPDELSHEIMVLASPSPFLSLISSVLVLLGEGYYAERSSKQTTEILQRRGMELEAQVEAMKATISDLEAEAKFFESTAAEASEGLVEIREEYEEDTDINSPTLEASSSATGMSDKHREHARIMAMLDELEIEEKEVGSSSDEDEEDEEDDEEDAGPSEEDEEEGNMLSDDNDHHSASSGASFSGSGDNDQSHGSAQVLVSQVIESFFAMETPAADNTSHGQKIMSKIISSGRKAFTGSIIEHDDNISTLQPSKGDALQNPASSSSRPVSRFKMQKGGR
ncbi:hypothetical protein ABZP36_017250 [Zizania latifolia]